MNFLAFGMPAAPEWIFIAILALVLLGPKKLPELARGIGKALGELQKAKEDFRREISGVPPLPKIESPQGLQGLQSTGSNDPVHGSLPEQAPSHQSEQSDAVVKDSPTAPDKQV